MGAFTYYVIIKGGWGGSTNDYGYKFLDRKNSPFWLQRGEGGQKCLKIDYVICERSLISICIKKDEKEIIEKQDVDNYISVKCVNYTRLFMICVNGELVI